MLHKHWMCLQRADTLCQVGHRMGTACACSVLTVRMQAASRPAEVPGHMQTSPLEMCGMAPPSAHTAPTKPRQWPDRPASAGVSMVSADGMVRPGSAGLPRSSMPASDADSSDEGEHLEDVKGAAAGSVCKVSEDGMVRPGFAGLPRSSMLASDADSLASGEHRGRGNRHAAGVVSLVSTDSMLRPESRGWLQCIVVALLLPPLPPQPHTVRSDSITHADEEPEEPDRPLGNYTRIFPGASPAAQAQYKRVLAAAEEVSEFSILISLSASILPPPDTIFDV